MIDIRGNIAKAHAHKVAVEGGEDVKVVHAPGFPAVIPASWRAHALERVTATAGDVIRADGRYWQVTFATLNNEGEVTYLFQVDFREGGERILHEASFHEGEVEIFACDPDGPPTVGDVVEVPNPDRPKKPLTALARNSDLQRYSQAIMPNGTTTYVRDRRPPLKRATAETLGKLKALREGRRVSM